LKFKNHLVTFKFFFLETSTAKISIEFIEYSIELLHIHKHQKLKKIKRLFKVA